MREAAICTPPSIELKLFLLRDMCNFFTFV